MRPLPRLLDLVPRVVLCLRGPRRNAVVSLPAELLYADELAAILDEIELASESDPMPEPGRFDQRPLRRATWFFGSYTVFLMNLHGVLMRIRTDLEAWCESEFGLTLPDLEADICGLEAVVRPAELWRHKVFAHTAFAAPRKGDTPSLRYSTLLYASGSFMGITPDGLAFGGGGITFEGDDEGDHLPQLTLRRLSEIADAVIRAHADLITTRMDQLLALDDDQIVARLGDVAEIVRLAPGEVA